MSPASPESSLPPPSPEPRESGAGRGGPGRTSPLLVWVAQVADLPGWYAKRDGFTSREDHVHGIVSNVRDAQHFVSADAVAEWCRKVGGFTPSEQPLPEPRRL